MLNHALLFVYNKVVTEIQMLFIRYFFLFFGFFFFVFEAAARLAFAAA